MRKICSMSVLALLTGFMLAVGFHQNTPVDEPKIYRSEDLFKEPLTTNIEAKTVFVEPIVKVSDIIEEDLATIEEIELIALVTMAEAEGECELGKRLVIDTILNRVDHEDFPDSISDVIYQPNQFSSMWNGRVDRCYVIDDICDLVTEELKERTNSDVLFFHANKYGKYGDPIFQVGKHYFSGY